MLLTREDLEEWKEHPVTGVINQYLLDRRKNLIESLSNDIATGDVFNREEQLRVSIECEQLRSMGEIDIDDLLAEMESFYDDDTSMG